MYSFFSMTQGSNYLDVNGVIDSGTIGTLDGNDVRLVSRAQLIGSGTTTYALGDGSLLTAVGLNASSSTNWNGDTGVHGSGPTTYDSVVASATLPSVPTTRATAYETSEQWDCQMVGAGTDFATAMASNSSLIADIQTCNQEFQ
jgi:hypothetical protein